MCGTDEESIQHLFYTCNELRELWDRVREIIFDALGSEIILNEENVILGEYNSKSDESSVINLIRFNAKWVIWKNRNNKKYNGTAFSVPALERQIRLECQHLSNMLKQTRKIPYEIICMIDRM